MYFKVLYQRILVNLKKVVKYWFQKSFRPLKMCLKGSVNDLQGIVNNEMLKMCLFDTWSTH